MASNNMETFDTLKDCVRLLAAHETFRDSQMKLKDNPHDEKHLRALEMSSHIITQFNHPMLKKIGQDAIEKVKSYRELPQEHPKDEAKQEEQPKKEEEIKEEASEELQSQKKKKPEGVKTKNRKSRVVEILNPRHLFHSKKSTKPTSPQSSTFVHKLKNLLQRSRTSR